MRMFGVEEELLLVDATTLEPLPAGEQVAALHEGVTSTGHEVTVELKQEQLEVISPPQSTLDGQLEAIRTGRALADAAAAKVGGRVVALPTAPGRVSPHLVPASRYRKIAEQFGITAAEQLTNGFHVHVEVSSQQEAVAVLDKIRIWLPALLALSANSPFWHGADTGYASYRYQVWSRWPTSGPTEIFGSPDAYAQHRQVLLDTQVPLDQGMLYFDAACASTNPLWKSGLLTSVLTHHTLPSSPHWSGPWSRPPPANCTTQRQKYRPQCCSCGPGKLATVELKND